MDDKLTDPASEIYDLAKLFREHNAPTSAPQLYHALPALFRTNLNSYEFYTILAAIQERLSDFDQLIRDNGDRIRPRLQASGLEAVSSIAELVNLSNGPQAWNGLRDIRVSEAHLASLAGLEQFFSIHYPMKLIDETELTKIIDEMNKFLADLEGDKFGDTDKIIGAAVAKGFRDMRLIMTKIHFFGRRTLEERIILTASTLQAARRNAPQDTRTSEIFEQAYSLMKRTAECLIIIGGVASGGEALWNYGGSWVLHEIVQQIDRPRLLTDQRPKSDGDDQGNSAANDKAPLGKNGVQTDC